MALKTELWGTELRKGILELCVLALLSHEDSYGYKLVQRLQEHGDLLGGAGTIYPLLARLERQGLVKTYWGESSSGPPRKYYRLSEAGHRVVHELSKEWMAFRDAVDKVLSLSTQSKAEISHSREVNIDEGSQATQERPAISTAT